MGAPYPAPLPLPHPEDTKPPLGRLLTERGLLTLEQLEEALSEKETSAARLGEILLGHGWLSEADIARALADQHDLEYLDLARVEVDPAAAGLLPQKFARRYGALPIRFIGDDHVLVALELKTGKILWQRWIESDVMSAPVATEKELFFSTFGGVVYKLNQKDGAILSAVRTRATSACTSSKASSARRCRSSSTTTGP